MSRINVTSNDISLVQQHYQRRFLKIQLVDKQWNSICVIRGRTISATSNIDSSQGVRRTANITIETEQSTITVPSQNIVVDLQKDISANYYIRLWAGIENNVNHIVTWYNQGIFAINQHQYNFDATTRTLSLSLVDLMCDLTGDRGGIFHAYTSLVKNSQRIDDVMTNVLELAGFNTYNITPICPLGGNDDVYYEPDAEDYMVPYDINFSAGVSAYEILEKLVSLYPYYEIGFDVDGTFFCRKKLLDQDDSYAVIDAVSLASLVISENTSIDWFKVKNLIEVWGKDGNYYGEAKDENPESPFQISSTSVYRKVITGSEDGVDPNNICDRYKDTSKAEELLKKQAEYEAIISTISAKEKPTEAERNQLQQAQSALAYNKAEQQNNVSISGNELANEWAQQKLYEYSRLNDSISITTICMPFLNDVNFKLAYRSKVDETIRPYMVESVSHDYIAGTSTFNMARFYNDMCTNMLDRLATPEISHYYKSGMTAVLDIEPVLNAESYILYVNGVKSGVYTSTTISYTSPTVGSKTLALVATGAFYRNSQLSNSVTLYFTTESDNIITHNHDVLTTNSGDHLKWGD